MFNVEQRSWITDVLKSIAELNMVTFMILTFTGCCYLLQELEINLLFLFGYLIVITLCSWEFYVPIFSYSICCHLCGGFTAN